MIALEVEKPAADALAGFDLIPQPPRLRGDVEREGLSARDPETGREVARILWDTATLEIEMLWVAEHLQRRGIATALYQEAQRRLRGRLRHSPYRTADGEAWAQSLGETLPEWAASC